MEGRGCSTATPPPPSTPRRGHRHPGRRPGGGGRPGRGQRRRRRGPAPVRRRPLPAPGPRRLRPGRRAGLRQPDPRPGPVPGHRAGAGPGRADRGRAAAVLAGEDLRPGEVVVVISNSGVNAVPVEVALGCRERGLRVVALTNLEQAKATAPATRGPACTSWPTWSSTTAARGRRRRHPRLRGPGRAPDHGGRGGRGRRPLRPGGRAAAGAGRRPPVLASQNLDGRPAAEANAELLAPYLERPGGGRDGPAAGHRARVLTPGGEWPRGWIAVEGRRIVAMGQGDPRRPRAPGPTCSPPTAWWPCPASSTCTSTAPWGSR